MELQDGAAKPYFSRQTNLMECHASKLQKMRIAVAPHFTD
jgi:hypothetical protein